VRPASPVPSLAFFDPRRGLGNGDANPLRPQGVDCLKLRGVALSKGERTAKRRDA